MPATSATIEPPKIEASEVHWPPVASPGNLPQIAPPPPAEKPKLAFENVGAGGPSPRPNASPNVKLPPVATTIEETLRASVSVARPTGRWRGGDGASMTTNMHRDPEPYADLDGVRSNLQLLSDPAGVDFKPYLQVLAAVRTNWAFGHSESARLGRRGRVLVQFIINRRGGVPTENRRNFWHRGDLTGLQWPWNQRLLSIPAAAE